MIQFFKKNIESNKKLRTFEIIVLCLLVFTSIGSVFYGLMQIHKDVGDLQYVQSVMMDRDKDEEDYDSGNKVCDVIYRKGDQKLVVSYDYEDYVKLNKNSIKAYEFKTENGQNLYFDHKDVSRQEASHTYKEMMAEETLSVFNLASATFILMLSVAIMMLFSKQFTTYEKSWFISIMVLATILSVLFPEDSANGVNGIIIMILYLLDTFLNILCELLISKQSRYNFLVSVLVEIVEIVSCVVLMYRFATMATTLFFWLPIDIISYINWSKHRDDEEDELTMVRKLKGYQEVLVIIGIIVWTVVVGYFISGLDITTDFYNNKTLETAIIYIDACASAVGIANGLFIFFRLREQWIAWYICAFLEAVINIMSICFTSFKTGLFYKYNLWIY